MLEYIEGNIFDSPAQVIVNPVNTVGVMGKGIALEFKKRYPIFDGEMLKTIPRPFPKDFKYPALLMRKDYVVIGKREDTFFKGNDWIINVAEDFKILQPFNRFLNYTVDDVYDY